MLVGKRSEPLMIRSNLITLNLSASFYAFTPSSRLIRIIHPLSNGILQYRYLCSFLGYLGSRWLRFGISKETSELRMREDRAIINVFRLLYNTNTL